MARHPVLNLADRLLTYRVSASSIIGAVDAAGASDSYRTKFEGMVRTIVSQNVRAFHGDAKVDDQDAELMAGYVTGIDASALTRFLSIFRELLARFRERHPEWRESADFRRTLARQIDAIAYRVRPPARRAAIRAYRAGIAAEPSILAHLSWPRAAALCVLGAAGRRRLAGLRPPAVSVS